MMALDWLVVTLAQAGGGGAGAPAAGGGAGGVAGGVGGVSLRELFVQSFDLFSVLLIVGSIYAVTVIVRCAMEVRAVNILPDESERRIRQHLRDGRVDELRDWVERDGGFVSRVVRAALAAPGGTRSAGREAAELAASEECGRWFRAIDPLNVVGNLGPLLGLAGTVWGMIIAFAALGQTGGQATPAALSSGIAKALFHTLLGLMLAVPSLLAFGFYRARVDRLCTRAMVLSAELVAMLPLREDGGKDSGA